MGLYERDYYREPDDQMSFKLESQSATMLLVYANVGIFLFDWIFQLDLAKYFGAHSSTLYNPLLWYQYLTYGFLHSTSSVFHVVFNMFVLWMFGRMVEDHYGKAEFFKFYFISVFFCGFMWNVCTLAAYGFQAPEIPHLMVGASGAVSTILIIFICLYPKMTILLFMVIPVPAWLAGVLLVLMNLLGSEIQAFAAASDAPSNAPKIAYSAHLAGIGFGLAYFYSRIHLGNYIPSKLSWPKWGKRGPKLRVHTEEDDYDPYHDSDEEAERLLEKVNKSGMDSLSKEERKTLEAYSRRMRQKHR